MTGGLVLAAGGSSRFGSPKQLAEVDGRPLLQHAVEAVAAVEAVDDVVVVLGADAESVASKVDSVARAPSCARTGIEGRRRRCGAGCPRSPAATRSSWSSGTSWA